VRPQRVKEVKGMSAMSRRVSRRLLKLSFSYPAQNKTSSAFPNGECFGPTFILRPYSFLNSYGQSVVYTIAKHDGSGDTT
jgi:hypothetical protein